MTIARSMQASALLNTNPDSALYICQARFQRLPASMSTRVGGVGRIMQSGFHPDVAPKVVKESNVVLRLRYWVPYIDHL